MTLKQLAKLILKAQKKGKLSIIVTMEAVEPEDGGGLCGDIVVARTGIEPGWTEATLYFDSTKELKSTLADPKLESRAKALAENNRSRK